MLPVVYSRRALFNPIIIASCTTAGLLRHNHISVVGAPMHFHYVFIDEAGQALLPEALVPMTLALSSDMGGAIMLVGDPKQLGPVVRWVAGGVMVNNVAKFRGCWLDVC